MKLYRKTKKSHVGIHFKLPYVVHDKLKTIAFLKGENIGDVAADAVTSFVESLSIGGLIQQVKDEGNVSPTIIGLLTQQD